MISDSTKYNAAPVVELIPIGHAKRAVRAVRHGGFGSPLPSLPVPSPHAGLHTEQLHRLQGCTGDCYCKSAPERLARRQAAAWPATPAAAARSALLFGIRRAACSRRLLGALPRGLGAAAACRSSGAVLLPCLDLQLFPLHLHQQHRGRHEVVDLQSGSTAVH